jgi:hypothetical protein
LLLVLFLLSAECVYSRWRGEVLKAAAMTAAAAVVTYLLVNTLAGNRGQVVLFNLVFVDRPDGMAFPNNTIPTVAYAKALAFGLFEAMTTYPEFILTVLALAAMAGAHWRALPQPDGLQWRKQALAPALLATIVAHYVLFPAPWERYFVGIYVMTVFLVAVQLSGAHSWSRQPADSRLSRPAA